MIDLQKQLNTKTILLPGGDYPITSTIVGKFAYGSGLHGVGCSPHIKIRHPHRGAATILHKTKDFAGPLLEIQGAYFTLRDLSLIGNTFKSRLTLKPHPIGVQITRPRNGIGSGKHHFSRVLIEFVDVAWCIGKKPAMVSCDCCYWESPTIRKSDTAFLFLNHQSMQHRITHCALQQVNTFIDVRAGGCIYVDDVGIMSSRDKGRSPTLLRVEQVKWKSNSKGRMSIGRNNGYIEIRNLKTDNKAGKVILLNQVNTIPIIVRLIGGKLVHPPIALLKSGGSLFIDGYSNLGAKLLTWNNIPAKNKKVKIPSFTLCNSHVNETIKNPWDLLNFKDSTGPLNLNLENNFRYPSGEKLPNLTGIIEA